MDDVFSLFFLSLFSIYCCIELPKLPFAFSLHFTSVSQDSEVKWRKEEEKKTNAKPIRIHAPNSKINLSLYVSFSFALFYFAFDFKILYRLRTEKYVLASSTLLYKNRSNCWKAIHVCKKVMVCRTVFLLFFLYIFYFSSITHAQMFVFLRPLFYYSSLFWRVGVCSVVWNLGEKFAYDMGWSKCSK